MLENEAVKQGKPLPEPVVRPVDPKATAKSDWRELFRGIYLKRTLMIWVLWLCVYMINNGMVTWLPTLYKTGVRAAAADQPRLRLDHLRSRCRSPPSPAHCSSTRSAANAGTPPRSCWPWSRWSRSCARRRHRHPGPGRRHHRLRHPADHRVLALPVLRRALPDPAARDRHRLRQRLATRRLLHRTPAGRVHRRRPRNPYVFAAFALVALVGAATTMHSASKPRAKSSKNSHRRPLHDDGARWRAIPAHPRARRPRRRSGIPRAHALRQLRACRTLRGRRGPRRPGRPGERIRRARRHPVGRARGPPRGAPRPRSPSRPCGCGPSSPTPPRSSVSPRTTPTRCRPVFAKFAPPCSRLAPRSSSRRSPTGSTTKENWRWSSAAPGAGSANATHTAVRARLHPRHRRHHARLSGPVGSVDARQGVGRQHPARTRSRHARRTRRSARRRGIRTHLDGATVQKSTLSQMIVPVPALIALVSTFTTLTSSSLARPPGRVTPAIRSATSPRATPSP